MLSNWEYYRCFNENVRMACARKINISFVNVIEICILNRSFLSSWNFKQNFKLTNCFDAIIGNFPFILLFLPVTKPFDKTVDGLQHCFENWHSQIWGRKWIVVMWCNQTCNGKKKEAFYRFSVATIKMRCFIFMNHDTIRR